MEKHSENIKRLSLSFFIVILIAIGIGDARAQQRVQFTQYMFEGLLVNPAYAGVQEALNLTFLNRDQWSGMEGAPNSQTLIGHTLFKQKKVGVGLSINRDVIGVHKNFNVATNYAYHLSLSEDEVLSFGLQAGIYNRRSDYSSLIDEFNNDPALNNANMSHSFIDFGAGLYYRSHRLQVGYSALEMIPQTLSINETTTIRINRVNHFIFSQYSISLNQDFDLEPSMLVKAFAGVPLSYDLNVNLIYRDVLSTGISYRKKESFDFLLKFKVTPQLQFGYSYDYPIGTIADLANASHELMIQYLFRFMQSNVASPR